MVCTCVCHPSHTLHIPTLPSLTTQPHPTYAFKAPALPSLSMICKSTHACMQHWNNHYTLDDFLSNDSSNVRKVYSTMDGYTCNPMTTAKSLAVCVDDDTQLNDPPILGDIDVIPVFPSSPFHLCFTFKIRSDRSQTP